MFKISMNTHITEKITADEEITIVTIIITIIEAVERGWFDGDQLNSAYAIAISVTIGL
jgi:hypothetical protein